MKNRKGFTLAELLIVVAVIAVLVSIAIPMFVGHLERSREAADLANLRSAYAEAAARLYEPGADDSVTISGVKLISSGTFEHLNPDALPFTLSEELSVTAGVYDVTFDFSDGCICSLAAQP